MWGRATLAMEVSSTSMKVPMVTTRAMIQGLKIAGGGGGCRGAGGQRLAGFELGGAGGEGGFGAVEGMFDGRGCGLDRWFELFRFED